MAEGMARLVGSLYKNPGWVKVRGQRERRQENGAKAKVGVQREASRPVQREGNREDGRVNHEGGVVGWRMF